MPGESRRGSAQSLRSSHECFLFPPLFKLPYSLHSGTWAGPLPLLGPPVSPLPTHLLPAANHICPAAPQCLSLSHAPLFDPASTASPDLPLLPALPPCAPQPSLWLQALGHCLCSPTVRQDPSPLVCLKSRAHHSKSSSAPPPLRSLL